MLVSTGIHVAFVVLLCFVAIATSSSIGNDPVTNSKTLHSNTTTSSHSNKTEDKHLSPDGGIHGDEGHDDDGGHHASNRIHVAELNYDHVKGPMIVVLVIIFAGLSKIGFHHADFLSSKVPESCVLILLGILFGAILYVTGAAENVDFFTPDTFFIYLLPPIILEAAFSLHDRAFSDNLGSIIMFSVVGTIIACFAIGLSLYGLSLAGAMSDPEANLVQILVFTALIVAVDPVAVLAIFQEVGVNQMLYFMVFGESLLNDGVTVVLYNVMQTYNRMDTIEADQIVLGIVKFFVVVFGGLAIGIILGILSAFITKYTNLVKVAEPIIIFAFAYESYILAEMFHFSGIVSIIGCGLTQVQYAFKNITNKSKLAVKFFAKVISNTSEIIIFLFLGLKTVTTHHVWNTGFVLWTLLLCVVYRFIITFGISWSINRCDRHRVRKIKLDEMFMISYGGLRGAVCFSLVALLSEKEFPMKNMFITTTLVIIFFTVFIQGGTIKWLVKKMRISLNDSTKDMIMYQELNQHITDHLMAGIEEVVGTSGKHYLREKFDNLDNKFFRPLLLRDANECDVEELNKYYEKLMMKEHYKNLRICGAQNLPRVASSIRAVDSSACLRGMDNGFEQKQLEKEEERVDRRRRLISQRSLDNAPRSDGEYDVQKMLRDALATSRNQTGRHFHDKNYVKDEHRHLVGQLRQKYKKNQRLSTMCRPKLDRALSWNENQGELFTRRTSDVKLNLRAGRAVTVDFSPGELEESKSAEFTLDDTVFEAEEDDNTEHNPLLSNNTMGHMKRVHFSDVEKQGTVGEKGQGKGTVKGQDVSVHVQGGMGELLAEANLIDSADLEKENAHNVLEDNLALSQGFSVSKEVPSKEYHPDPRQNDSDKTDPKKSLTKRADSHHGGHELLRQDALKDADIRGDIELQELGKTTLQEPSRKMSV
ncbi:sodium/hydrogen exchanger 4-like isoform X1 [Mya arenaria]|uniref:sodium/hydrogen exchanger 4-like isoform X1 n=1 Tax=Mya arenaria TaxID=6604 RepID=UPI0022E73279|nr:sodium/hydrogen exchanger 4-like isoform X1 [Mya arenaria]XP_052785005.1 sodium/hydrogen exchanger 4-like isoform X1 [Mya arenaria]XP_052785006.1 sodium/hydrogen exchanger 4-like isoform X1 [Mya arenaria]